MTQNEIINTKLYLFRLQILSSEYAIVASMYFIETSIELRNQTLDLTVSTPPTYLAYIGMIFAFISQWLSCIATTLALQLLYQDINTPKIDIDNGIFFYKTNYLNLYISWQRLIIFRTAFLNEMNAISKFV